MSAGVMLPVAEEVRRPIWLPLLRRLSAITGKLALPEAAAGRLVPLGSAKRPGNKRAQRDWRFCSHRICLVRLGARGTTAVEIAMLGPVLVVLVLVLFEVGMQAAVGASLDYGARRASRLGITGAATANGEMAADNERRAALRGAILSATGGLLSDALLTLNQSSYATVAAAAARTGAASGPGQAKQVVRYDLTYRQPLLTGNLAATVLGRTEFTHTSTILVINEPFPTP